MPGFFEVVETIWKIHCPGDSAKRLSSKFKLLRKGLKKWSTSISQLNLILDNCNDVIQMVDELEDQRSLHISEWNFRRIVQHKMDQLLKLKESYWKQRCTARWAKRAEENTSYYHAMATISYRRNSIASLQREDGSLAFEHEEKAGLLWHTYRQRLGVSVPVDESFDFSRFIQHHDYLAALSAPFSMREIEEVLKSLPNAKAPRPDGFSGLFLKKCWHIIKWDFFDLFRDF